MMLIIWILIGAAGCFGVWAIWCAISVLIETRPSKPDRHYNQTRSQIDTLMTAAERQVYEEWRRDQLR